MLLFFFFEWGDDEKLVVEIVEFNVYGNKFRCLMCLGIMVLFIGVFSGVCLGVVVSVSSGVVYIIVLMVLGVLFGLGGIGMMGICVGLYFSVNGVRIWLVWL